jgi:hypothetical protein
LCDSVAKGPDGSFVGFSLDFFEELDGFCFGFFDDCEAVYCEVDLVAAAELGGAFFDIGYWTVWSQRMEVSR